MPNKPGLEVAAPADVAAPRRYRALLPAILAVSLALRLVLVFSGGQHYLPDESRYWTSRAAAKAFWSGDLGGGLGLLRSADHFLFKVIGTLPASVEVLAGEWPAIPATFFALFSVFALGLLWAILRRLGENERTALFGTALLALSTTFFYYSRHLVPYDLAMASGLLALYVGLGKTERFRVSLGCGLLAAATFLTYNGYWVLAGFALVAHTLRAPRSIAGAARRALLAGAAFVLAIAALLAADRVFGGTLVQQLVAFSGSVTQGSFAEGWMLPFPYFWHAEHGLTLLWAAALLFGCWSLPGGQRREALLLGLAGVSFVYGSLFFFSMVIEKFVVYGRLARQLTPFFCILAALLLERLWTSSRRGRQAAIALLALAALQAGCNFRPALIQVFPAEFHQLAAAAQGSAGPGNYQVLNAEYIWPEPKPAPREGVTLLRRSHPSEYLPLQYEGYDPQQRAKLRAADISLRLFFTPPGERIFDDGFESGGTGAWSQVPHPGGAGPASP